MSRGVVWLLLGSSVLVTLAGCGRGFVQFAGERAAWRHQAEVACLNSGTVRETPGLVRISPIEGPGMCGADFPFKVSVFGEGPAVAYTDTPIRPPGSVPGGGGTVAAQPRWPIQQQPLAPPAQPANVRAATGPMSLEAPGVSSGSEQVLGAPPSNLQAPSNWQRADGRAPVRAASPSYDPPAPTPSQYGGTTRRAAAPQVIEAEDFDDTPEANRTGRMSAPQTRPVPQPEPLPPLGPPARTQQVAATPIEIRPAATLACPVVSALDRWFAHAVQPAAQKWFKQPVVEVKQISAYSCRGMNGQAGANISEHAFGNALDIAAFVLADGHRITVKNGWNGSPEEQGFLRDIQGAACDQFTTVLAPGSNHFHYDHIHVDLMRRASGRRICNPGAVDGDVVAARARGNPRYASKSLESPPPSRRYDPPPAEPGTDPFAWRGDLRADAGPTGSVRAKAAVKNAAAEDSDWVEDPSPRPAIDWSKSDRHRTY